MGRADEIRRTEGPIETGQYACGECGLALGERSKRCPECSSTEIVELRDVIDPEFRA